MHIDNNPNGGVPLTHEDKDKALFNEIAQAYCQKDLKPASRLARRQRLRRTLAIVPLAHSISVLEVGCGAGFSPHYLEGLFTHFTGVDYAENLIAYANQYNGGTNVEFHAANIKDYQPETPLDVIFMIGVLHHFDDVESVLEHTLSMLAPGGWFVANEPQSTNILIQGLRALRTRIDKTYSADQIQFSPEDIERLYHEAGLVDISVRPQGLFSTPFAEVAAPPQWLWAPFASLANVLDTALESSLPRILLPLSWNIVAAGRKPPAQ